MEWYVRDVQQIETVDIDARSALEWADLLAELIRKGRTMPFKDSLIAASARQHDLTIATRNVADFRYAGVRVVNPFTGN
jgi:predicted nucleic acid-binding protein